MPRNHDFLPCNRDFALENHDSQWQNCADKGEEQGFLNKPFADLLQKSVFQPLRSEYE
jgi:hypothetical protein